MSIEQIALAFALPATTLAPTSLVAGYLLAACGVGLTPSLTAAELAGCALFQAAVLYRITRHVRADGRG